MRLIRIDRKFIDNRWICYFHIGIFLCILNVSFCCKQIHFTIQAGIVICIEINITLLYLNVNMLSVATVYKGNIIKNLIMDCQSYTKYRPNETTGGIFVSWRRKEELPTGA